jgi:hypothetical protein
MKTMLMPIVVATITILLSDMNYDDAIGDAIVQEAPFSVIEPKVEPDGTFSIIVWEEGTTEGTTEGPTEGTTGLDCGEIEYIGECISVGCAVGGSCGACGDYIGYNSCIPCVRVGGRGGGGRVLRLAAWGIGILAIIDGPVDPPPASPCSPM